jgi:excisionase family DNA binding protein
MIDCQDDVYGDYDFASSITGIKKNTLYGLVHNKRIPHHKLNRRFIRFSKIDLLAWMNDHRVPARKKKVRK